MWPLAAGLLGTGLLGTLATQFWGTPTLDVSGLEQYAETLRRLGTQQIQRQLGQANIQTAEQVAARGLGASGIAIQQLGRNRAAAMQAAAQLEAELARQLMQARLLAEQAEYQAKVQRQRGLQELFGGMTDIGGSLLALALL